MCVITVQALLVVSACPCLGLCLLRHIISCVNYAASLDRNPLISSVCILSDYFNLVGEYWLATQVLLYDIHNCVVLLVFIVNKDLTVDQ